MVTRASENNSPSACNIVCRIQKGNMMCMRILFLPSEVMAVHVKCDTEITYLHIMIIILSDKYRLSQPLFSRALWVSR